MPPTDQPSPCLLVIFGASGDLTQRKLIPSLYDLFQQGLLPEHFAVLGVSRTGMSDDDFRGRMHESVQKRARKFDQGQWDAFAKLLHYHPADPTNEADFSDISGRMSQVAIDHKTGDNALFYLSLAPQFYDAVISNIGSSGLVTEGKAWCSINRLVRPWQRIIVEKPFGHDVETAAHLNRVLGRVFEDESVFRIDHYLGKETVQNLMVFRFANAIFEPVWNRQYIDHVQVTAAETVGVEGRGSYYDSPSGGAMRDMIQSHLLQVMAVVAMEPPGTMQAQDIRTETTKVLNAVRPIDAKNAEESAVRGRYGAGLVKDQAVPGYLQEPGVAESSQTETYAALRVDVDNWRWQGVPFFLRSGKRMARKLTQVVVQFKAPPHVLFSHRKADGPQRNRIVINVQPDEGIQLSFQGKIPGVGMKIGAVEMDFDYAEQFKAQPPEAYATLLLDAMRGDQTLFKQRQEIEQAWRIVQPVLNTWAGDTEASLPTYAAGTWGPTDADYFMAKQGRQWLNA
ncbi:MAG: glucose-6-phosphate dehydrogenase [Phycisphaeraceae bacterium]|nr:glucose-6-phosphate dehydrogenase [Phycisphaeraceae bacterium]